MPKYCLRSTGEALWLPLHGMNLLISVVLHGLLVKTDSEMHTTFV